MSFADTPEQLLKVNAAALNGMPVDAITAACLRADAVLCLLQGQFAGSPDGRYADHVILNALWDVQGTLSLIKTMVQAAPNRDVSGGAHD